MLTAIFEQSLVRYQGDPATARTDQFSFCVALYEALYRMRPFAGTTYAELLVSVTSGAVLAPPDVKVPAWIRRVLLRGLSIDPDKRYPSMAELLAALAHDPARRRRRVLAWTGTGVLVAGGVAFALLGHRTESCGSGDDRIAAVWSSAQRTKLASVFATSNRPIAGSTLARVTELVDGWKDRVHGGEAALECAQQRVNEMFGLVGEGLAVDF